MHKPPMPHTPFSERNQLLFQATLSQRLSFYMYIEENSDIRLGAHPDQGKEVPVQTYDKCFARSMPDQAVGIRVEKCLVDFCCR